MSDTPIEGGALPVTVSDILLLFLVTVISAAVIRKVFVDAPRRPAPGSTGPGGLPYTATQGPPSPPDGVHAPFAVTRMHPDDMAARNAAFLAVMAQRRSLRFFAPDPVPMHLIQQCVEVAGTAPSGAHCQPWTFVIVTDPEVKAGIRTAVEAEEQLNYDRRMRKSWVSDVAQLVTGLHGVGQDGKHLVTKPYLTEAPALAIVMKQTHGVDSEGGKIDHYYVEHSVGLAVGMFLAALTNVGLYTLTSTPMGAEGAIRKLCGRPDHEKVFLLMPIGWPSPDATVPHRTPATLRKPVEEVMVVV